LREDNESSFVRFAAICSFASAITTFLMWFLPRLIPQYEGFDASLQLANNVAYMSRWWINFAHIFLAITAYSGAAVVLRHRSIGWAFWSLSQFFIWGFTELLGVSVTIWAVNRSWRAHYLDADTARRNILRTLLEGWPQVWDGMFFVLLVAFLLGSLSLGLLAIKGRGLERATSVLLLLSVPLSICIITGEYWNVSIASRLESFIYPILQPISRAVMGGWLWSCSLPLDDADRPR